MIALLQVARRSSSARFDLEEVTVADDRAAIRWRFRYGDGEEQSVRGVNLMQVRAGQIVKALGSAKIPAERAVDLPVA